MIKHQQYISMIRGKFFIRASYLISQNWPIRSSFIYNLSLFSKKNVFALENKKSLHYESLVKMQKQLTSYQNIQEQLSIINEAHKTIKQKQHHYGSYDKEVLRKIIRSINYKQLNQITLENLQKVIHLYLFALSIQSIQNEAKIEAELYAAFVKHAVKEKLINGRILSQTYIDLSKMKIDNPYLRGPIPQKVIELIRKENNRLEWVYDVGILLDLLAGLANRDILIKDEIVMMVLIIGFFSNEYDKLTNTNKALLMRRLLTLNPYYHFGIDVYGEKPILSKFLMDLQNSKVNIREEQLFRLIENDYPVSHADTGKINQIIMQEYLSVIDSKGKIRNRLNLPQVMQVLIHYSKKYRFSLLSETQRVKLMEFIRIQMEAHNNVEFQDNLAIIIANNFFKDNLDSLRLIIKQSNSTLITARLAFQLSFAGIKILKPEIMQSLKNEEMLAEEKAIAKGLLVLAAAFLQTKMDPFNEYCKDITKRYEGYFRNILQKKHYLLLKQLIRIPQTTLHSLYKIPEMQSIIDSFEEMPLQVGYGCKYIYIYLLIRLKGFNLAQRSKWFPQDQHINLLAYECLRLDRQGNEQSRVYSSQLLIFIHIYNSQATKTSKSLQKFINIKLIMNYLLDLTRAFKYGRISYQSPIYLSFWQALNTLINYMNEDNSPLKFCFHRFIDIFIVETSSHFSKTQEYYVFLKTILSNITKLQPQFQVIGRLITSGIYTRIVTQKNYQSFLQSIRLKEDIRNQAREIVLMWQSIANKTSLKIRYSLTYFVNPQVKYSEDETLSLLQGISKLESSTLAKSLELFDLPITPASAKLLKKLLEEYSSRNFDNLSQIYFPFVFSNIRKYIQSWDQLPRILSKLLQRHLAEFDNFTLRYHLNILEQAGKKNIHNREYQQKILKAALSEKNNPNCLQTINILANHDFQFNYKELRQIQALMRQSSNSWLRVFLLMEEQILPQMRNFVASSILKNQILKPSHIKQLNNQLIHNYLANKYPQAYSNSSFAALKAEKSYRQATYTFPISPNMLTAFKHLLNQKRLASKRSVDVQTSIFLNNPCLKWDNMAVFLVKKTNRPQIQFLKRLLSVGEMNTVTVVGVCQKEEEMIMQVGEELNLELSENLKAMVIETLNSKETN